MPFLVRWTGGGIVGGRAYDGLTSTLDLYPTLLSAAGADPEAWAHCDGMDQLSALRAASNGAASTRGLGHRALHWDCGFQWAVREGDWKLHVAEAGQHAEALRRTEHTDIGVGVRLTNLADDIAESRDLAAEHPDVVERLTALHEAWRAEVGLTAATEARSARS